MFSVSTLTRDCLTKPQSPVLLSIKYLIGKNSLRSNIFSVIDHSTLFVIYICLKKLLIDIPNIKFYDFL